MANPFAKLVEDNQTAITVTATAMQEHAQGQKMAVGFLAALAVAGNAISTMKQDDPDTAKIMALWMENFAKQHLKGH